MQNKQHRPSILLLVSGIALLALGALFSANSTSTSSQAIAQFFGTILAVVGGVLLAIGIGYIVMFYGLLKGKGWAWTTTVILTIIGIAIQIVSTSVIIASSLENTKNLIPGIVGSITFPLIGLAINIVILYYLYRRHVRAYFGKAKPQPPTTV